VLQQNYNRENNEFVEFSIWHKHISNVRGGSTMENLIADFRYAVRTLVKTPAFLFVRVLTLALELVAITHFHPSHCSGIFRLDQSR
jgi:hypothetical protein